MEIERKLRKHDRGLSRLLLVPNSEGKTSKFELTAVCKESIKRLKQTDRKIVWKKDELFRLSSGHFQSVFEFLKDSSKCLKRSSSFQELHNDMTHVLKRPCSGREECRKVSTSWPELSRAI